MNNSLRSDIEGETEAFDFATPPLLGERDVTDGPADDVSSSFELCLRYLILYLVSCFPPRQPACLLPPTNTPVL